MADEVRLRLDGLTKRFGASVVLDEVSLQVRSGEVHGLIGQNGAGKSTTVKILAGLYPDHEGTVTVDGHRAGLRTPRQSRAEGIAVIFQEFSLVSEMTIAENLLLGREAGSFLYSGSKTRQAAQEMLDRVGIDIGAGVDATVGDQNPAVRQRIEIAKALAQDARVLIMDEPTARLSESERSWLFHTMRRLCDGGVGIMFISHFLEEVLAVTDWLTVLRSGRVVSSAATADTSVTAMAELMLGPDLTRSLEHEGHTTHADDRLPHTLVAQDLSVAPRLRNINVALRRGEILGVAGLVGSGRTRLCRVLAGVDRPTSGQLHLNGAPVTFRHPRQAIDRGIALIPEDRKHQGLSLISPVEENLALMALRRKLGSSGFVRGGAIRALGKTLIRDLAVLPASPTAPASTLSGGNQQKIVLGKTFAAEPEIYIVDQPTAGVDIGTKAQIHRLLRQRAEAGASILVVSDDIDELYTLSDRFCVMRKGEVLWQGPSAQLHREQLLQLIAAGTSTPSTNAGTSL